MFLCRENGRTMFFDFNDILQFLFLKCILNVLGYWDQKFVELFWSKDCAFLYESNTAIRDSTHLSKNFSWLCDTVKCYLNINRCIVELKFSDVCRIMKKYVNHTLNALYAEIHNEHLWTCSGFSLFFSVRIWVVSVIN